MSTLQDLNQVLSRKQDILENAAGVEKIKKSGKLTARELEALRQFAAGLDVRRFNVLHHSFVNASSQTPQLFLIQKNKS